MVDSCGGRGEGRSGNEFLFIISYCFTRISRIGTHQTGVTDKLSCQPEERLLKVVVGLGGDVVILEVLLSVEGNGLGFNLSLLDINLVTSKDDGNVLADTDQVTYIKNISTGTSN